MADGAAQQEEVDYSAWSHADLVSRVQQLEQSLKQSALQYKPYPPSNNQNRPKAKRKFDPSRYTTRLIALKVAYLGGAYNGFEHQPNNDTPLPTVEAKLMETLLKSRLVAPNDLDDPLTSSRIDLGKLWPGEEVTQYSKCGRTDRGVSGFGQVIGIRVRSTRPAPREPPKEGEVIEKKDGREEVEEEGSEASAQPEEWVDIRDELPYVQILNRLLPPDIQVLAWAPNPPADFSARFNCIGRHYRYFFTNPAVPLPHGGTADLTATPTLDSHGNFTGVLDIPRMQQAAQLFLGHNDFRNFCKLDASKQIQNFKRYIYASDIVELPPSSANSSPNAPKIYYFDLHGSAFLWHQVRHMVAILFLVAQHYEPPEIVTELLNAEKYPRKPLYEMADDRALVLWDCYFPKGTLDWVYGETERGAAARDGLVDTIWTTWHASKLDEVLKSQLYAATLKWKVESLTDPRVIPPTQSLRGSSSQEPGVSPAGASHILVDGGSKVLFRGKYRPVLQRKRMETVDVLNERYRNKKPEKVGALGKGKKGKAWDEREEKELEREAVRMNIAIEEGVMMGFPRKEGEGVVVGEVAGEVVAEEGKVSEVVVG
ncbi:pseudouridine synthase [Peziza echinospora]|nr:pseudouridine synthase [Peziza echinospora]